jgi:cholesterol transport system auxiliary component
LSACALVKGSPQTLVRRFVLGGGLVAAALSLSACGPSPLLTYDLSAPQATPVRPISLQIIIPEPSAVAPFDADRIVVRSPTQGITVLPGSQWSDRLPELLQSRMIQAFENAKLLRAVGRPGERIVADYSLVSEIRRFEIDAGAGEAVVELSVKLVGERSGRIGPARVFEGRAPATGRDGAAASAALDVALSSVLRSLVTWAAQAR